ncbi:MAG TPA: DNA-deoxyinosine glycosylase [Methylophaga aminisulfidivorans]|uniref:DNA-deoxyinosine glycosylase n=1 Tax=Methylophaga aminisulfidivorans TaxID=230105 RepID=A0A7C2AMK6_9GAMM|nr:DNA-deoxyinosine glycosylase [Methylophaga aminisulfidivorans]
MTKRLEEKPSYSFSPIANEQCRILILGSMPSKESLAQTQYYAHPRNAFWSIMYLIAEANPTWPYERRCQTLLDHHIAVWDVLKSCVRKGSLDSAIETDSVETNDFHDFFSMHRNIKAIFFNGAKAEALFEKWVLKQLDDTSRAIPRIRLPSTSPAHAAVAKADKISQWQLHIMKYLE